MLNIVFAVLSVVALGTAVIFLAQRSLLYHPANRGMSCEELYSQSLSKWPSDENYRGYLSDSPTAERTIILFHGNAGEAAGRAYYRKVLASANARIILAEYPGYGTRPGVPSEDVIVDDAITTMKLVTKEFPQEPIIVIGESMGSGVISAVVGNLSRLGASDEDTLSTRSAIQGLILITPWDSLVRLAQSRFQFLPARWLVLDKYDSIKNLQAFDAPKAIVVAGRDRVVPARHGHRLFEKIPSLKKRFIIDAAGHNNWREFVDDQWWQEIMQYLSTSKKHPATGP